MKKILMLALVLLFVGCGSSSGEGTNASSDFENVDNSVLKTSSNSYGYYGDKVKFGNHTLARRWTFTKDSEDFHLIFSTGSSGYHMEGTDINSITYGASKDGREVKMSLTGNNITIRLDSVIDDYCYNTTLTNTTDNNTRLSATVCAEK